MHHSACKGHSTALLLLQEASQPTATCFWLACAKHLQNLARFVLAARVSQKICGYDFGAQLNRAITALVSEVD